jgi:hypothetical protein
MRMKAVVILLAIMLSIVLPPLLPYAISHDGQASIGIIDVCHSATPAFSSNGDMPCITGCPCNPLPLALEDTMNIVTLLSKPHFIANQDERPPKS